MFRNPFVRLLNNWLHDVASGLWAACLLVIWVLVRKEAAVSAAPAAFTSAMADTRWIVLELLIAALIAIAVTGVLRLAYWRKDTPAEELPAKRPALIVKHVAYIVVYGGGTWWAYVMAAPR